MIATTLDHLGWLSRDAGALHGRFERLGFRLTPWASHRGPGTPGTPPARLATGNRCAMLRDGGYLELIGITDPALPRGWIGPYLDRGDGIPVLALGMDDAEANLARLRRAGSPAPPDIVSLARPVSDADGEGPQARFALLPLADSPEGRVQLVQHLTPELLWQECFLDHPNRAVALEAAIIVAENPASSAARLSRLAGRPVVPDPLGGFALPLARGVVRLLPPEALPAALPGAAVSALPCVAGAVVRVNDDGAAIRALLGGEGREVPGGVVAEVGGRCVLFTWREREGSAG